MSVLNVNLPSFDPAGACFCSNLRQRQAISHSKVSDREKISFISIQ